MSPEPSPIDSAQLPAAGDLVGVAMLGVAHAPHAMSYARCVGDAPDAQLVGIYDDDPILGAAIATQFDATYYDDVETLLADVRLRAVIVCGETIGHRPLVELAARHGLHVLCEKPIATIIDDAEAMIRSCEEHGVQLHTAFVSRFYPVIAKVRSAISSGRIGEVVGMVGGNRGRPPLPPSYPPWITDPTRSGGGALIDHSVHVTDIMRHLTGHEIVRVNAEVDDRFWSSGVDDMAVLSVAFDNGAIATIDPSWSVPGGNPWSYDFFLRILGTEGVIAIDDTTESLRFVGADQGLQLVPFGVDIDALMVEAFLASVRTGRALDPSADGEDGLRALEVALAGYDAAASADSVLLGTYRSP